MFAKLKAAWSRLAGARAGDAAETSQSDVEYKGFRIRPTPYQASGQFQTAGVIRKDVAGEVKEHAFVRAEKHAQRDDAVAFAILKAKQIIDERGDGMFA